MPRVTIQTQPFDWAQEVAQLHAQDSRVGAVCSFVGTVREYSPPAEQGAASSDATIANNIAYNAVHTLELEHYPGMTEKSIEAILDLAQQRFGIFASRVVHRVGVLQPLESIVLVAVTAAHRGQSFQACEFIMDYLKTQAPFWKKEHTPQGPRWVDARVSDDAALARWGVHAPNA